MNTNTNTTTERDRVGQVEEVRTRISRTEYEADETTGLLQEQEQEEEKLSAISETLILLKLSVPVIGSYFLSYFNNMIPILTMGHLGTQYLAAISLTTMTANISGFSIGYGLATALDTLCSQAFTASTDKSALGKHLQRSFLVITLASLPILLLWAFTEKILLFLGQDPEISRLSAHFMLYMMPGLLPQLYYSCILRYLQAQSIMAASLIITLISVPINVLLQILLVYGINGVGAIGPQGACLATSITYFINFVMISVYAAYFEGYECWGGWSLREMFDFQQIVIFLNLGIPGVLMMCSEWWAFEVVALVAGLLGDEYLAAQTIMLNTGGLTYMVPMSLGIATSTRIGNALGSNLAQTSRAIANSAFLLGLGFSTINCLALLSVKDVWGRVYSSDQAVVELVSSVIPLAAFFQLADGLGAVASGILRGSGRQKVGAWLNLTGYYLFGLPLGLLFTFTFHMGLNGIWLGLTLGMIYCVCVEYYLIQTTDWQEMCRAALALVRTHSATAIASDLM